MQNLMQNEIIISSDFKALKGEILGKFDANCVIFFDQNELLIDDARQIIAQSYIAQKEPTLIVIMAKIFRIEAQNALLKILEEPPKNIFFCIVAMSKNLLLETVRSRLIITQKSRNLDRQLSGLNLANLSLEDIANFIDEKLALEKTDKFDKNSLITLIHSIIIEAIKNGIKFSQSELEYLYKLSNLASLNAKSHAILTPLLLIIYEKGNQ